MSHASAIDRLDNLTAYDIARMVECATNNEEAQVFILNVRDQLVNELGTEPRDLEEEGFEDTLRELASEAPDVMTHTRMLEAIGTGCHNVASDMTETSTTMVELAGYVLSEQAVEIQQALLGLYKEELLVDSEPTA